MNSVEEQMQMLDLSLVTSKTKPSDPQDSRWGRERSDAPTVVKSNYQASSPVVQGSFTGAVVQATIQPRQGRALLASGIRIFDDMVLNEVKKTNKNK